MRRLAMAVVAVATLGCGGMFAAVPVPPEHADLIGDWSAPDTTLEIHADGQVAYERHSGGSNTSVTGPVSEWGASEFTVMGLTTFHIETAPHAVGGGWETTIDGVTYHRGGGAGEPVAEDPAGDDPAGDEPGEGKAGKGKAGKGKHKGG
jgi:hypothetical protein